MRSNQEEANARSSLHNAAPSKFTRQLLRESPYTLQAARDDDYVTNYAGSSLRSWSRSALMSSMLVPSGMTRLT